VTAYVPAVFEASVQDAVTVAFAVMLVPANGQVTVRPVAGVTVDERVMLPEKSNVLVRVTVIVELVAPLFMLTGLTVETVNSPTWTVAEADRESEPGDPAPFIVTV
jgi:hypothetical protein